MTSLRAVYTSVLTWPGSLVMVRAARSMFCAVAGTKVSNVLYDCSLKRTTLNLSLLLSQAMDFAIASRTFLSMMLDEMSTTKSTFLAMTGSLASWRCVMVILKKR